MQSRGASCIVLKREARVFNKKEEEEEEEEEQQQQQQQQEQAEQAEQAEQTRKHFRTIARQDEIVFLYNAFTGEYCVQQLTNT
jgi:FtsZ-interacting cell division protein YlmF